MRKKLIALLLPATAILAGFSGMAPASAAGTCDGGGGAGTHVDNAGTLTLSNCTLSGLSSGDGGAINNTGTLTLNNVTLTGNSAEGNGGAIWNSGTIHVNGVTVGGAGVNGNTASGDGGGIYNAGGIIDGTNLTVLGNSAVNGGGIYEAANGPAAVANASPSIVAGGSITVTNGTISNNTASSRGGGAYLNGPGVTLTGFTIAGNTSTGDGGGLLVASLANPAVVDQSTIGGGNHAGGGGGGAAVDSGTLQLTNSSVLNNSAVADGGGVLDINNDSLHFANDTFSGNTAVNGGGIADESCDNFIGVPPYTAAPGPGAPNFNGAIPAVNLTISGNTATANGGGLYTGGCGPFVALLNPTIADNKAAVGGGIWTNNRAEIDYGNALFARNAPENCVDTGGAGSGDLVDVGGANLDTGNTCQLDVPANTSDQINVANPGLDVLADNFGPAKTQGLLFSSPAIDAVVATACPAPATDERGTTRAQATKCDTGAYECTATTPTVTLVAPSSGPPGGGSVVTITGTGFDRPGKVLFGTTPGVNVVINSTTQITATTPPGTGTEAINIQTCRANNPASGVAAFTFVGLPPAGQPADGRGQNVPWAWLALAMLLATPAIGFALLGRRRRVIS